MNLNEYAQQKESLIQRMLRALLWVFQQFIRVGMSAYEWARLTRAAYVVVIQYRQEATELARQFYDTNRAEQTGSDERHDIFKDDYYPIQWFSETIRPTYENFQRTKNVDGAIQDLSNRVMKVVEDGARRTLIQGVKTDVGRRIRGWARFDPRPPTCAFCTMMISRGPVYSYESGGGLSASRTAEELWAENDTDAMNALMNRWHPGCTCIVVPVYKLEGYPTQAQEEAAFEIYKRARRRAKDKTYKGILKEMRSDLRNPATEQDETTLAA